MLVLIPILIFLIASGTDLLVQSVTVTSNAITGTFGSLIVPYRIYIPLYIFLGIRTIIKKYKTTRSYTERNQVKYVLLAMSLFIIPASITNAILPLWFKIYSLNSLGPAFSVIMIGLISYAIVRHQLLDIKVVIQRGLIYSVLISTVIVTYLSLIFTFEYIFNQLTNTVIITSGFITTLLGIFGVPPLKEYFKKVTDPIFFKDGYNYALVLDALTDVLNKNISLETITEKTTVIIHNTLKPESVTFALRDTKKQAQESVLSLPIKSNKKNIGTLYLGKKKSGDDYTKEDLRLLETFTKQAGTALEKASLYKQVKEYAKTLEKKVDERTAEIRQIQKDQEAMMLEISHGLQTPLTIMKGELFFLRKQGYDQTKVNTLDASIDRISLFIYRLLSLSHLENSKINTEKTPLDISSLTHTVISLFQDETQSKEITLTEKIADGITIAGNKESLEELLSNLIGNAIKYIGTKTTRTIHVELHKDKESAVLSIADSGIGVRTENIPHLFEKFYRIKEDETRGISGTGLGLVICKKIVEMHDGTISVTSTFGKGTTFTISLPIHTH